MTAEVAEPLTETNPNRPTEAGYCANCGWAPCLLQNNTSYSCTSATPARPVTAKRDEKERRWAVIDTFTADEMRTALIHLSGGAPEAVDAALEYAARIANQSRSHEL